MNPGLQVRPCREEIRQGMHTHNMYAYRFFFSENTLPFIHVFGMICTIGSPICRNESWYRNVVALWSISGACEYHSRRST